MAIPFQISVSQDTVIRGDIFPAKQKPKATIIVCHGFKGFKDWGFFPYTAEKLSEHFHVLTFNFSHNGVGASKYDFDELEKFARNTYSRELEDLHIVIQHIEQGLLPFHTNDEKQSIPSHQLTDQLKRLPRFLLGHSRGGGVSLIYACDHPQNVYGVISWNGIANVDLFNDEQKQEMRTQGRSHLLNARTNQQMPLDKVILDDMEENVERFNIVERIKTIQVPVALIQGTDDHPRLLRGSELIVKNNSSIPWIKIEGGNHTFCAVHPFDRAPKPLEEAIQYTVEHIKHMLSSH